MIEIGRDEALAEAEREIARARAVPSPVVNPVVGAAASPADLAAQPDRKFDDEPLVALPSPSPASNRPSIEEMLKGKGSALNELLDSVNDDPTRRNMPPLSNTQEIVSAIKLMGKLILQRPSSEESLTSSITSAAKTGEIVKIFPKIPLRNGLQPGVLPGLVDSATTSAAALTPLIGDSLAKNVEMVSQLQADPAAVREFQAKLPEAMPDSPSLHPLSNLRETALQNQNEGINTPVSMEGPPIPSLLETSTAIATESDHHHHHHHHEDENHDLRKDQATDIQYLRGIGQGIEVLADLFGGGDADAQKELLEISTALKGLGSEAESPLYASLLEVSSQGSGEDYRSPPPYGNTHNLATKSVKDPNNLMAPSTFASAPMLPQNPAPPKDELSWMLEGMQAKGYTLDTETNPPERLDVKRILDSVKGILKKGQKMLDTTEGGGSQDDPTYKNKGFEGWPQPFWWTRPPSWLDDIPTWMQRLQMKKGTSLHRAAALN